MPVLVSEPPMIFVWAGKELPSYAQHSLRLADARYSGQVILLSEHRPPKSSFQWFDIRNFVNPLWEEFRGTFSLDPLFRGGLWLHAYERFFVLDEFCRQQGIERAFHAELDTLVLDLHGFSTKLDSHGPAIFVPMVSTRSVVASLVYWNSPKALHSLCEFFTAQGGTQNEMNALADFLLTPETKSFSFATEQAWDTPHWPYGTRTVSTDTGIVDAAAIAKWLFGGGPRTTQCTIWSKHRPNTKNSLPIDSLRFSSGLSGKSLRAQVPGEEWRQIRSLHVASKIHRTLAVPAVFVFLVWASRLPLRLPLIPRLFCLQNLLVKAILSRLKRHSRLTGGATARAISRRVVEFTNRRGINLSNSQRQLLKELTSQPMLKGRPLSLTRVVVVSEDEIETVPPGETISSRSSQIMLPAPPEVEKSGQWLAPEILKKGIELFGLDPATDGAPLLADVDSWPVLLAQVVDTEGIFFADAPPAVRLPNPMLTEKEQIQVLSVHKNHWSRQQVRFLLNIEGEAPSWSCNPHNQLYRTSHLQKMFPDQEALLTWWNKGRNGLHKSSLADYYSAWLMQHGGVRVKISFHTG